MDKVKLDDQPPKDATSNQMDTVNDENKDSRTWRL